MRIIFPCIITLFYYCIWNKLFFLIDSINISFQFTVYLFIGKIYFKCWNYEFVNLNESLILSVCVSVVQQLQVIQTTAIVRCKSCRTYMNPFVSFVDNRRWRCNVCTRVNEGIYSSYSTFLCTLPTRVLTGRAYLNARGITGRKAVQTNRKKNFII